ncbi:MAG: hypothetical protein V1706_11620 [Pseudomonadota bacterium]
MTDNAETIKELKAAILAIEWEISDEAMDNLAQAIKPLQSRWVGQKPLLVCLQVIGTLGLYVKKARERAHQDAIKLLHSVFATLEKVYVNLELTDAQKVALVRGEVAKYNALKDEISRPHKDAPPAPPPPREAPPVEVVQDTTGGGGTTMRNLMDQKEDTAVDGAFNSLFQGMVGDDRQAPPPPMPPMPSAVGGPDAKEIRLDRVDDEVFPEADSLLDDFFGDDDIGISVEETNAASQVQEAEEGTVEVDIGRVEPERKESLIDVTAGETAVPEVEEEEEARADKLGRIIQKIAHGVSEDGLRGLADEVADLQRGFPNHSSMHLFLQFIAAVGRHLQRNPGIMEEDSCRLLQKNYDRLNHSLFTMKPQKSLLGAHLEATADYIAWNESLVNALQSAPQVVVEPPVAVEATAEPSELSAAMEAAVTDIVRREVDKLREELMQMMEKE